MSIYARYKRSSDGFRQLVELMESSPKDRRDKMLQAGMKEDAEYTKRAAQYFITFEDIIKLNDSELAEVVATATPKIIAASIANQPDEIKKRFLICAKGAQAAEIRDLMDNEHTLKEIGGARLKMIAVTRSLEKKGLIQLKKLPA